MFFGDREELTGIQDRAGKMNNLSVLENVLVLDTGLAMVGYGKLVGFLFLGRVPKGE